MDDIEKTKQQRLLEMKLQDLADAKQRLERAVSLTSIRICQGCVEQSEQAVEQLQREILDTSGTYQ